MDKNAIKPHQIPVLIIMFIIFYCLYAVVTVLEILMNPFGKSTPKG